MAGVDESTLPHGLIANPSSCATMDTMRAWLMDSYDGVEKLRLDTVPDPVPGPGQALICNRFAALNPADAFLAQKLYPANPPLPHILGRDGAGEVAAVGPGVTSVRPGDM